MQHILEQFFFFKMPTQKIDTDQILNYNNSNNKNKNNIFNNNNDITIKINQYKNFKFRGQYLIFNSCIKYTLRMFNTLQLWIKFRFQLVYFFKQFAYRFQNSWSQEKLLRQSTIANISRALIILLLVLSSRKL